MRLIRYSYPSVLTPRVSAFTRSPWSGLETEMDRMFDTALAGFNHTANPAHFPVDLYEDRENTYVRAELPGVNREDIQVEMVDGYLTITATRKPATAEAEALSFSRSVEINEEVQAGKVSAAFENGVLAVTLPKREEAKPKKITVAVK